MPQNMIPQQVASHRSPRRVLCCFITSLLFVFIVPTACIMLAVMLRPGGEISYIRDKSEGLNRTKTMLVEWSIDRDTCDAGNCTEVNIFFGKPTDPIIMWNATNWNLGPDGFISQGYDPTFRTELIISLVNHETRHALDHSHASLLYYPFDRYNSEIFACAQDASTNESVSLVLNSAAGLIVGLKIATEMVGEDITYREDLGPANQVIDVIVTLQRSILIIGYCLIITFTFWLVTLMICLLMIATIVFGFRQRNEIVVVPIGTVFAFTQLRSSMPGAPEGSDLAGLLPCLILLSISAVTMVGFYLFANPDDSSRRTFTWDELEHLEHRH
ncbi:hypothetical protein ARMSODRAFT_975832 [Armillaria solidipes]|uniref:Uncharacterized protein n=1 Tax=Armillaria solidipes TaxID=1076256 RepID=A0A2H3BC39_9AGAR|nr:hypothetical protein ARMSODRAFT_975832 [Armillaria solidipes]